MKHVRARWFLLVASIVLTAIAASAAFDSASVGEPATEPASPGALEAAVPAFPGALGFGAISTGGRGGDVYHVTSLADSGAGSLRDAIESASGPRTILFEVGGTIDLSRPLVIDKSFLTIAGQTAPGGIGTRGYPVHVSGASDVVIRYMRFRTGDINAEAVGDKPARGNGDLVGDAADALSIGGSQRVIIDHVSASWGMDETLSVTVSADVTVQHSIISEGLDASHHQEGRHGYGSLIRGTGVGGYSIVGNLYAHHTWRSPAIGGFQDPAEGEPRPGLDIEIVNNVIYDWESFSSHTVEGLGTTRLAYQGNVSIAGPSTAFCWACSFSTHPWDLLEGDEMQIYRSGNVVDSDQDARHDPVSAVSENFTGTYTEVVAPFDFARAEFEVLDAGDAYERVIAQAGASLSRDAVDIRIVLELVARKGGIIDSQDDVGGWPEPAGPLLAPEDLDRDGMADVWEEANGLDPADPEDRNGFELDGKFTNLEIYLDSIISTQLPAGMLGDVDCGGSVDAIDAALLLRFTARLLGSLPCADSADVNQDGDVDAIDVALVLQFTAGLLGSLP